MERILVTGITGNSGGYFQEELLKAFPENMSFRMLVRSDGLVGGARYEKLHKMIGAGHPVELFRGDLYDPADLAEMTRDIDTVFHIAGVGKSLELTKAALKNGVKRLIYVHTTGIYSKYKAAGEEYRQIEASIMKLLELPEYSHVTLTILRPTMIYGSLNDANMIKFIKMTDKLRLFPMVSGGHFALQPVHQEDLGKAYYKLLTKQQPAGAAAAADSAEIAGGSKARALDEAAIVARGGYSLGENPKMPRMADYTLSGGTVIDLIDIMKLIGENLGKKNTFFPFPFRLAYFGAWCLYIVTVGHTDFREKVQRLVEPRAYSHEKATEDFGYAPMPFSEGIRRETELYKAASASEPDTY